jgi:ubiquinone/menaquinone biosynthesis C-methylase UbiE
MPRGRVTGFDETAESYDAWYASRVGHLTDHLEKAAVFALVPEHVGRAADLSCGTGNYALELARRGWQVVGIDRSMPMLRVAARKARSVSRVSALVQADAAALPVRDGSLDLVTLILGLEFMADPSTALREVRRVLRPGGCVVVAVLSAGGLWTRWRRLKRWTVASVWREARFLTEDGLDAMLRERGFVPRARRRAVAYLPWPVGSRLLRVWERTAQRCCPGLASFVVIEAGLAP